MNRKETRRVLWHQNAVELSHAQDYEAEIERLEKLLSRTKTLETDCRKRAVEFKKAAEELGALDEN